MERNLNVREEAVTMREQALLKDQEEWKEWKERVENEINEDLEVLDDNREMLEEWRKVIEQEDKDKGRKGGAEKETG